jgi:hypothetical protein
VSDCFQFYSLRDLRTSEYLHRQQLEFLPVHVAIDAEAINQAPGQLALLSLANQLARVHRRITFDLPSSCTALRIRTPFAEDTVQASLLSMVSAVDPCGEFQIVPVPNRKAIAIGIGTSLPGRFDWYLGANHAVAHVSRSPSGFSQVPGTLRGAALASCLGAAAAFRTSLGFETAPRSLSAWNYAEGKEASLGPANLIPLDIGRTLMVGAGAVGASLAYWLHAFGVEGAWTIVDRDVVELHNLNRGLVFTAADAGWPANTPRTKAEIIARLLPSARWDSNWYDESQFVEEAYDVVLGLANDRNVRHFIASRNNAVTLHATTGENWLSQLHRHVAGVDDCIWCRAGEIAVPAFRCSTASLELSAGSKTDAALPFLSAAGGLMLATALERLQTGELVKEECNDWRWDFASCHRMVSSGFRRCHATCTRVLPVEVRRQIDRGSRWIDLTK